MLKGSICFWIICFPILLSSQYYPYKSIFDGQDTVFLVKDFGGHFKTKLVIHDSIELTRALHFFKIDTAQFKQFSNQLPKEILFPFPKELIRRYKDHTFDYIPYVPICYLSEKGDTYYSIARGMFGIPLLTLMRRNNLENSDLEIGKPLLIGWHSLIDTFENKENLDFYKPVFLGDINQIEEIYNTENAVAIKEGKYGPTNQNLALSNSYPLGKDLLIYHPVTGIALKIKIVGKIPLTLYQDNVSFVVSEDIANRIGAKDKKFLIRILKKK